MPVIPAAFSGSAVLDVAGGQEKEILVLVVNSLRPIDIAYSGPLGSSYVK